MVKFFYICVYVKNNMGKSSQAKSKVPKSGVHAPGPRKRVGSKRYLQGSKFTTSQDDMNVSGRQLLTTHYKFSSFSEGQIRVFYL